MIKLSELPFDVRNQIQSPVGASAIKMVGVKKRKPISRDIQNRTPEMILAEAVMARWPDRVRLQYDELVPGRRFRADIAFVDVKCLVEFDGWQYHGKTKSGFQQDRMRQNLLTIHGWRILRFYHAQVKNDLEGVLSMIEQAI